MHRTNNRHNDKNIKEVLLEFIGSNKRIERGVSNVRIEEAWKEHFGPVISGYTSKVKLYEGKLEIYITSAPLRHELSMSKDKIANILNEAMGKETVKEVIVR